MSPTSRHSRHSPNLLCAAAPWRHAHEETWKEFDLPAVDSKIFLEQLALQPTLLDFLIYHARWDYDARRGKIAFRTRKTEHVRLSRSIVSRVGVLLEEMDRTRPTLASYLNKISEGLAYIEQDDFILQPDRELIPDLFWLYDDNYFAQPTVILEVSNSRSTKDLESLARAYDLGTSTHVRAILIRHQYYNDNDIQQPLCFRRSY